MFGLENFFGGGGEEKKADELSPAEKEYVDAEAEKLRRSGAYVEGESEKNLREVYRLKHSHDRVETEAEKAAREKAVEHQKEILAKHIGVESMSEADAQKEAIARFNHPEVSGSRTPDHIN